MRSLQTNELFKEHVKLVKARKNDLESLEDKDKELSVLKAALEENNSSLSYDQDDITKNGETNNI